MAGKPQFSDNLWISLRSEFESGDYSGIRDFYDRYVVVKLSEKERPTRSYLERRSVREHWSRKANAPAVKAETERLSIEMFARRGCPPEKVADRLVAIMRRGDENEADLVAQIRLMAQPGDHFDDDNVKRLAGYLHRLLTVERNTLVALDQYAKLTGQYAAVKYEHGGMVNVKNNDLSMEENLAIAKKNIAFVEKALAEGIAPWKPSLGPGVGNAH